MSAAPKLTLENAIQKLDDIPALPTVVYELSKIINDPMSSTTDVEKVMSTDQGLTLKVLRLVNSAYYAIPGGVSSLSRAIAYIGFDSVHQLVLGASIIKALQSKGTPEFDLTQFWKHAIGVAVASESIAKFVRHPMPSDLFICGLVHDMGKIALYVVDPETLLQIVRRCKIKKCTFAEAEGELETIRHTIIGQMLANKWNLPSIVQAAIKYHHTKEATHRVNVTAEINRSVDIVLLANLLINALKFGQSGHEKVIGVPKDVMERLTINPDEGLKQVLTNIKADLARAEDFVKFLVTTP